MTTKTKMALSSDSIQRATTQRLSTGEACVRSDCRGKGACCSTAAVYDRRAAPVVAYHGSGSRQQRAGGGELRFIELRVKNGLNERMVICETNKCLH